MHLFPKLSCISVCLLLYIEGTIARHVQEPCYTAEQNCNLERHCKDTWIQYRAACRVINDTCVMENRELCEQGYRYIQSFALFRCVCPDQDYSLHGKICGEITEILHHNLCIEQIEKEKLASIEPRRVSRSTSKTVFANAESEKARHTTTNHTHPLLHQIISTKIQPTTMINVSSPLRPHRLRHRTRKAQNATDSSPRFAWLLVDKDRQIWRPLYIPPELFKTMNLSGSTFPGSVQPSDSIIWVTIANGSAVRIKSGSIDSEGYALTENDERVRIRLPFTTDSTVTQQTTPSGEVIIQVESTTTSDSLEWATSIDGQTVLVRTGSIDAEGYATKHNGDRIQIRLATPQQTTLYPTTTEQNGYAELTTQSDSVEWVTHADGHAVLVKTGTIDSEGYALNVDGERIKIKQPHPTPTGSTTQDSVIKIQTSTTHEPTRDPNYFAYTTDSTPLSTPYPTESKLVIWVPDRNGNAVLVKSDSITSDGFAQTEDNDWVEIREASTTQSTYSTNKPNTPTPLSTPYPTQSKSVEWVLGENDDAVLVKTGSVTKDGYAQTEDNNWVRVQLQSSSTEAITQYPGHQTVTAEPLSTPYPTESKSVVWVPDDSGNAVLVKTDSITPDGYALTENNNWVKVEIETTTEPNLEYTTNQLVTPPPLTTPYPAPSSLTWVSDIDGKSILVIKESITMDGYAQTEDHRWIRLLSTTKAPFQQSTKETISTPYPTDSDWVVWTADIDGKAILIIRNSVTPDGYAQTEEGQWVRVKIPAATTKEPSQYFTIQTVTTAPLATPYPTQSKSITWVPAENGSAVLVKTNSITSDGYALTETNAWVKIRLPTTTTMTSQYRTEYSEWITVTGNDGRSVVVKSDSITSSGYALDANNNWVQIQQPGTTNEAVTQYSTQNPFTNDESRYTSNLEYTSQSNIPMEWVTRDDGSSVLVQTASIDGGYALNQHNEWVSIRPIPVTAAPTWHPEIVYAQSKEGDWVEVRDVDYSNPNAVENWGKDTSTNEWILIKTNTISSTKPPGISISTGAKTETQTGTVTVEPTSESKNERDVNEPDGKNKSESANTNNGILGYPLDPNTASRLGPTFGQLSNGRYSLLHPDLAKKNADGKWVLVPMLVPRNDTTFCFPHCNNGLRAPPVTTEPPIPIEVEDVCEVEHRGQRMIIPSGKVFAKYDGGGCNTICKCVNQTYDCWVEGCPKFFDPSDATAKCSGGYNHDDITYIADRGECVCYAGELICQRPVHGFGEIPSDKLIYFLGISTIKTKRIKDNIENQEYLEDLGLNTLPIPIEPEDRKSEEEISADDAMRMAKKLTYTLNQIILMETNESRINDTRTNCRLDIVDNTTTKENFALQVSNEMMEPDMYGRSSDLRCKAQIEYIDSKLRNREYDHFILLQTVYQSQIINGLPLSMASNICMSLPILIVTVIVCWCNLEY